MVSEKMSTLQTCKVLEVSRSGYYSWLKRPEALRTQENKILIEQIKKIHKDSRGTYGVPRVQASLKNNGKSCGKERIRVLMKKAGISGLIKAKFSVKTTDSKHEDPIAPRIFKTEEVDTHPTKANEVWASDITYVHTDEGLMYLAMYKDIFTKKLVGHATGETKFNQR